MNFVRVFFWMENYLRPFLLLNKVMSKLLSIFQKSISLFLAFTLTRLLEMNLSKA
jgi:hypothetical protein